jgi:hypothetical protein
LTPPARGRYAGTSEGGGVDADQSDLLEPGPRAARAAREMSAGTLEILGRHLTLALRPLGEALGDPDRFKQLMYRMGWRVTDLPPAYAALGTAIDTASTKLAALGDSPSVDDVTALIGALKDAYQAIRGISDAPGGVDAGAFLAEIGERLFELLLTDYLALAAPSAYNLLCVLNVIQLEHSARSPERASFMRATFKWSELPKIVTEPLELPGRVYGWGTPDLNVQRVVDHLAKLFFALGFPVTVEDSDDDLGRAYAAIPGAEPSPAVAKSLILPFFFGTVADVPVSAAFALRDLPASDGKLPGLVLEPQIPETLPLTLALSDTVGLRVTAGTNVASQFGILVRPGEVSVRYPFESGTTPPSAGIGVGFDFKPATPAMLFGSAGATRLELQGASVDLSATSVNGVFEAVVGGQLTGFALVLAAGESDSFIHSLLGDGETRIDAPLGVEWSSRFGVRFKGSAGFEVAVHPHLSLGPVAIDELTVRLAVPAQHPPDLLVELGATISGKLGPLQFFVKGIGLSAGTTFANGNVGPFDIQLGFKPPNGVGLAIGGGGFKGGGFLVFDSEKGEYAGGLELEFQGVVAVKAVGILNTKMPDGSPGFSLLIIISAEFTPIQLGFGFTLIGVGGLLGLNHTADYEALRAGIHDGSLNSVLFPQDIVANAPRIINDLKRAFPPLPDRFLIGPMAKLGWGTPALVSLEIGILLEIPRPAFAILGILRVTLPTQDAPILDLKVAFLGVVDFQKSQLSFDASLLDSHVVSMTLTGDMAVRVYWGDDSNLLLTVGGFHPAYTPPPMGLPALQRLAIDIFPGTPKIRAESYFAVTSNTVQFGARVEVSAGASVFNIYGFMAYDVLIQRHPFHFIAEFTAMLAVRSGSSTLFGVKVDAMLEGPSPWHVKGTGSFEIGFVLTITISVHFDVTLGDLLSLILPAAKVFPLLTAALEDAGNWRAVLPLGSSLSVSLRELSASGDALVLHPFGTLEISQKVVPLNLPIDRFGAQKPDDGKLFRISDVIVGSGPATTDSAKEQFAPAQFLEMSDAEKLSRKSFEKYDSGVRVGAGDRPRADYFTELDVAYEVIYVPEKKKPVHFRLGQFLFDSFVKGSAVAQSDLSFEKKSPSGLGTDKVAVAQEKFAVATTDDLTLHAEGMVFDSDAEAHAALRQAVTLNPALTDELQVVPTYQLSQP